MRFVLTLLALPLICCAADEPLLLQKPALSNTHIVFVYAGDLWSVPRAGGDAIRLTSGTGNESEPAFSPDGTLIAFTGEYDGNVDVFVIPATGGVPKRLTWHPAPDRVLGWTPDGKRILFTSPRSLIPDSPRCSGSRRGRHGGETSVPERIRRRMLSRRPVNRV